MDSERRACAPCLRAQVVKAPGGHALRSWLVGAGRALTTGGCALVLVGPLACVWLAGVAMMAGEGPAPGRGSSFPWQALSPVLFALGNVATMLAIVPALRPGRAAIIMLGLGWLRWPVVVFCPPLSSSWAEFVARLAIEGAP